jgi:hypothetical protein
MSLSGELKGSDRQGWTGERKNRSGWRVPVGDAVVPPKPLPRDGPGGLAYPGQGNGGKLLLPGVT